MAGCCPTRCADWRRPFRLLNVLDDFNRECLRSEVDNGPECIVATLAVWLPEFYGQTPLKKGWITD